MCHLLYPKIHHGRLHKNNYTLEGIERRLQSRYEFDARSFPETVFLSSLAIPGEVKLTWTAWDVLEMTFQGKCFKLGLAPEEANFQISKCSEE
jgi:hypothetical protein